MGLPPGSSEPVRELLDYAVRPTQQLRRFLQSREQVVCSHRRIASSWRMPAKAPRQVRKVRPATETIRPGKDQKGRQIP